MGEPKVAQQREFDSLDAFISGQNNFYLHFLDDCFAGNKIYRTKAHFKRFQETHLDMERAVTRATVEAARSKPRQELPHEQLWEAYKIMSELVFVDDEFVIRTGQPDTWFLCR